MNKKKKNNDEEDNSTLIAKIASLENLLVRKKHLYNQKLGKLEQEN